MTEPTDTLLTDCTIASDSLRSSTSRFRKLALLKSSRASLNLLVASDRRCEMSARQP